MFDAVAGKNQQRSVPRQPAIEKSLRQAAHAIERLRVGDAIPCAAGVALCQEYAIGRYPRPVLESFRDPLGVGAELLR